MKKLGAKKTKTKIQRHQNCGVCHPEIKAGRSADVAMAKKQTSADDHTIEAVEAIHEIMDAIALYQRQRPNPVPPETAMEHIADIVATYARHRGDVMATGGVLRFCAACNAEIILLQPAGGGPRVWHDASGNPSLLRPHAETCPKTVRPPR